MKKRLVIVEDRVSDPFQFSGYYYSKIEKLINSIGYHKIASSPEDWEKGDVIIFNYPQPKREKKTNKRAFKEREIEKIDKLVKDGKIVIFTGYYNNEDEVCDAINSVSKNYGIEILDFVVKDEKNCLGDDEKMVITSKVYGFNENVEKVLFGYCAPVVAKGESKIFVESEKEEEGMAAYYKDDSGGMLIVIGTCTFWDNYSIDKLDNRIFTENLLNKKFQKI